MTTVNKLIWAESLPTETFAQRAELIALTKALELNKGKEPTFIWPPGMFLPLPMYMGKFTENAEGKMIRNKQEILALLTAIWHPTELAIIYFPGQQKGDTLEARRNRLADMAARQAGEQKTHCLTLLLVPTLPSRPQYTSEENHEAQELKAHKNGMCCLPIEFTYHNISEEN